MRARTTQSRGGGESEHTTAHAKCSHACYNATIAHMPYSFKVSPMSVPCRERGYACIHIRVKGWGRRENIPLLRQVQSCVILWHIITHVPLIKATSKIHPELTQQTERTCWPCFLPLRWLFGRKWRPWEASSCVFVHIRIKYSKDAYRAAVEEWKSHQHVACRSL
jgi:hypothetical protein